MKKPLISSGQSPAQKPEEDPHNRQYHLVYIVKSVMIFFYHEMCLNEVKGINKKNRCWKSWTRQILL